MRHTQIEAISLSSCRELPLESLRYATSYSIIPTCRFNPYVYGEAHNAWLAIKSSQLPALASTLKARTCLSTHANTSSRGNDHRSILVKCHQKGIPRRTTTQNAVIKRCRVRVDWNGGSDGSSSDAGGIDEASLGAGTLMSGRGRGNDATATTSPFRPLLRPLRLKQADYAGSVYFAFSKGMDPTELEITALSDPLTLSCGLVLPNRLVKVSKHTLSLVLQEAFSFNSDTGRNG